MERPTFRIVMIYRKLSTVSIKNPVGDQSVSPHLEDLFFHPCGKIVELWDQWTAVSNSTLQERQGCVLSLRLFS